MRRRPKSEASPAGPAGVETLRHEGELRLPQTSQLAEQLRAALASGRLVELDLAGVDEVDLSGLQLLCSAHRTFCLNGLGLTILNGSERLFEQARLMGFQEQMAMCPYREGRVCLWHG